MPTVLDSCVLKLTKDGKTKAEATAICTAQLKKAGKLKAMDKNIAHDIVHKQYRLSEDCPFCKGEMNDAEVIAEADRLVEESVRRRADMDAPYYFGNAHLTSHYEIFRGSEEDDNVPDEIQVLPKGKWQTGQYGEVEINDEHIDEIVENFNEGNRAGVPIDIDHKGEEAVGWVKKLIKKADGLFAKVDWNKKGKSLLEDKAYRFISPEFSFNFKDPLTSTDFGAVLIAATITNFPLFRQMKAITASEQVLTTEKINGNLALTLFAKDTMTVKELLAKPQESLTEEEKTFIAQNAGELTPEQRKQYNAQTPEEKAAEEKATADAAAAKGTNDGKTPTEGDTNTDPEKPGNTGAVEGKEKTVTLTAAEVDVLKKQAKAGQDALDRLTFKETEETVNKDYIMGSDGGKVLPKGKTALTKLMLSFSEVQKNLFKEVMTAVPNHKLFNERGEGDNGKTILKAAEEIDNKAKDLMKANDSLTYSQALDKIEKENPDLYQQYKEEMKG